MKQRSSVHIVSPAQLRLESEQGFLSFDTVHGCDFLSLECEPTSQTFSSLHPATIAATAIAMAAVTTGHGRWGPLGHSAQVGCQWHNTALHPGENDGL